MPVAWHPSLASGNATIDAQHQELLRRLADLVEALESGRRHEIAGLFAFLGDYVVDHFDAEERAMERSAYPGRNVHVAAHARFVRQYAELREMYEQVGPCAAIAVKTATWIQDWLESHIYGADRALARHLRDVGDDVE
ncbi:MAG TPA: hemerythrin family protein [Anaeromyxobacter sp.]